MPLGEVGGSAGRPGSIKVNETLILGSAPRPAKVRSHSARAAVVYTAAPSARDGGGEGRDRGVNSAPVVLQQAAKGGLSPSLCFSPVFFSCGVPAQAALAAVRVAAYFDQTLVERIRHSLPAKPPVREANVKSKSSTK